jgi:hypothetical protein
MPKATKMILNKSHYFILGQDNFSVQKRNVHSQGCKVMHMNITFLEKEKIMSTVTVCQKYVSVHTVNIYTFENVQDRYTRIYMHGMYPHFVLYYFHDNHSAQLSAHHSRHAETAALTALPRIMATTSSHPSLAPRCGVLINSGDALQILL